ncbi:MHFG family PEP-CTERM protein [Janthinobacterium sp. J1-1]|uniref:MHFG family PEP-CTERM protein n=1 Tax=Janthinobacterium sp. J1-1 TaxID=3065910 RepID=UPI0028113031|nr:MHFG family PEP-CTERM protein [Janthinobacterium sp. J1-1]
MISYKKLTAPSIAALHRAWLLGAWLMFGVLFLAGTPADAQAKGKLRGDVEDCSWDRPGADPFMGDVVAAVDRYTDIAPAVREQLKQRMRARQYDEIVVISRDTIRGKQYYDARITEMHFGQGRVCRNVTRAGWSDKMEERGLVYCVQGECILVPTICRNVSRISPAGSGAPRGGSAGGVGGAGAPAGAGGAARSGVVTIGGPEEGPPMWDNPDALRGGVSIGDALPPVARYTPFVHDESVRFASNTPIPSGGGGGVSRISGGPGYIQPQSIVPTLPVEPNILPAVPEPQTWAMLLAGLACIAHGARRRKRQ